MKKLMLALIVCAVAWVGFARTLTVISTVDEFPTTEGALDKSKLTEGTLRWALANANDGDTIAFDAALAGQTITVKGVNEVSPNQDSSLVVDKAVTIVAPAGGITIDSTFKDGNRDHGGRLFKVPEGVSSKVTFSGIRFYRGNGRGWNSAGNKNFPGGACYVGSPVKFVNCMFEECKNGLPAHYSQYVDGGGGAILAHADLELESCEFIGCSIEEPKVYGGVIMAVGLNGDTMTVSAKDTVFTNCYSKSHGGCIWIHSGVTAATFERCSFVDITSRGDGLRGGVIYATPDQGSAFRVDHCVFRENGAQVNGIGGAVFASRGKWLFNGCEFYRNVAGSCGGALGFRDGANGEPECFAVNCTFCQNWCGSHGGAADVRLGSYFVNCTFAGNRICNKSDNTASASIYSQGACDLLNCCSVYAFNVNGWISNQKSQPVSTGNFTGLEGSGKTLVNCLVSNYMPVLDLDDAGQLAAMSKLFLGYEYWEYPVPVYHANPHYQTPDVWSPENGEVTTPTITDDPKHPDLPRVCGIEKGGLLDGTGYPVKANADFSYLAYSADGGTTWTTFYGTDDDTATLISADQRGMAYKDGIPPVGAAAYAEEHSSLGLIIVVR